MIEISFQNDGRIKVFAMDGSDVFSVTTTVNKIQNVVPHPMMVELRDRMIQFLEETTSADKLKIVSRA